MTFAPVGSTYQGTTASLALTPAQAGDLILVEVLCLGTTVKATSMSGGGCNWSLLASYSGTTNGSTAAVFAGTVAATGSGTATISFSGATPTTLRIVGQEFSSSVRQWALDAQGNLDVASGSAFPPLTPAGGGELYFGYASDSGTATAGSTPGFTYFVDAHANGMCYNAACGSGTQQPTWADTGEKFGISVLVKETPPVILNPPTPKDWVARYDPQPADFNTYVRDTFNYLASPPRLRVVQNAVQNGINSNTWTTIQFQSVTEDTYSGWTAGANNYYQAQVPGWYAITHRVTAAVPSNAIARVGLQYQLNGTIIGAFEFNQGPSALSSWGWDAYDEVYLSVGDQVYPQFFQEYTAAVSTSLTNPSSLEIVWLSL